MSKIITSSIKTALIISIVTIFMYLIGFTEIGAELLGELVAPKAKGIGLLNSGFAVFVSLIGLFSAYLSLRDENTRSLRKALVAGVVTGLVSGLVIALFGFMMGALNANGVNFRDYLKAVSPEVIKLFIFNKLPMAGAFQLGLIIFASTVLGSLLIQGVLRADWRKKVTKELAETNTSSVLRKNLVIFSTNKWVRYVVALLVAAALIILPREWGSYWNYAMGTVGIYILLGIGVNLIIGLAGQLIIGYVAFFAIGAYAFALLTAPEPHHLEFNFWVALGIAGIAAAVGAIIIGLPILNLRGDYLAIVTLGFAEIVRIMIKSDLLTDLTGGPRGIRNIPGPTLFGKSFATDIDFMYIIIIAVVVIAYIAHRLQNSRTGRAWIAIREDETVAQTTGVDKFAYKMLAFALSAVIAGIAGALFASRNQFTGPDDHVLMVSINVICLLIVGGMGSLPGIILGSFVLKGFPELLRQLENYRMLIFGALLIVMMLIRPEGLWPAKTPKLEDKVVVPEKMEGEQV
jgi:ABC-type branched-subunit amino acid transport system permease subunit